MNSIGIIHYYLGYYGNKILLLTHGIIIFYVGIYRPLCAFNLPRYSVKANVFQFFIFPNLNRVIVMAFFPCDSSARRLNCLHNCSTPAWHRLFYKETHTENIQPEHRRITLAEPFTKPSLVEARNQNVICVKRQTLGGLTFRG